MASTQSISEFNGSGATETTGRTDCDYKAIDDSTTARGSSPISAANNENSYFKVQALKFGGTWASISSVTVKASSNAPATGLAIVGAVATSYTTPSRTATGDAAMSTSGLALNLVSSTTPFGTGTTSSTASGSMYTQALRSQLQAASTYAGGPGDTPAVTFTWSWVEA